MTRAAILVEQNWNAVPGGTARSTNLLIDALRSHTDVLVAGVHGRHGQPPRLALPENLPTSTVPIPGRVLAETWSRIRHPRIDRWIDADVVHAPAYVVPPTNKPLVATIHDLAFVRHPEWFTPNGVAYLNRFLDRIRASDAAVIVPSDITAADCVARGIRSDRVRVIPWGIDVAEASSGAIEDVRDRYELPEAFVLFVGTVEPRKNLHTLADAMVQLPDTPLIVVGPVGWGEVSVPGARLLGEVPSGDIEPLMAAATVLAYPSHFEGFGLPVLEAMAQGTPVVTTAGTVPAEIAGVGGVAVDTRSADALAVALGQLLNDADCRREVGAEGRARASTFRWQETARLTADTYEAIL